MNRKVLTAIICVAAPFAVAVVVFSVWLAIHSSKQQASEMVSDLAGEFGLEKKNNGPKGVPGGANTKGELPYPALPIRDAFGEEVYIPEIFSVTDVYNAIAKVEPYCDSDYERDKMVLFMIWKNQPYMDQYAFQKVRDDYLQNFDDVNIHDYWDEYCAEVRNGTNKVPMELLLVDEKESEVFGEIVRVYRENGDYDMLLGYYSDYALYLIDDHWEEATPLFAMLASLVKGNYKYEGWLAGMDQQNKGFEVRELEVPFRDVDFMMGNWDYEEPYVSSHK